MVKKELIIVLMVISMFLVSACDVYDTLFIKQNKTEGVVEVPEEDIFIDMETKDDFITEIEEVEIDFDKDKEVGTGNESIPEEEPKKEIPEGAIVTIVEETELVSLVPKAEDPDKDTLTFTFTSPLDDNGEWQTNYGDAGEYTVTITASDGLLTTSKEVLIIVKKKEEAPVLESFEPKDTLIKIDETGTVSFGVDASDLNNDKLTYSWKLDGIETGDKDSIEYKTTYEDSGSHTIKVTVSDGTFDTEKIWSVTVNNVNRKPILAKINDIKAKETDVIFVELGATDHDGDDLSYEINDDRFIQEGNIFRWETTYDDAGEHAVTATVSDGIDETSQEFTITVEDVNRAPVILDIVQK